jgi:hypothetical protein
MNSDDWDNLIGGIAIGAIVVWFCLLLGDLWHGLS